MDAGIIASILAEQTVVTSTSKKIEVISCSFNDLINSNKVKIRTSTIQGQLFIPEYQRPYIWSEKQINRLLNDFIEYQNNTDEDKSNFYLGSIIVHKSNGLLKIIDGQQRITTLLLMLSLSKPDIKSGIVYTSPTSINNIKKNYAYLKSVYNKDIFEFMNNDVLDNIRLDEINVTLIVTPTEDLAYTFFETQNTGGVRLSGSDIIKAHHLRALESRKIINHQARKWESYESGKVENIIQNLTKIRYWDNRNWRLFPFYRDEKNIKSVLIDEFTEQTKHNNEDVSYYYSAVKMINGQALQMHESQFKNLKQPLSDGNNSLDYINDYVNLYDLLFNTKKKDFRVSDEFYEFVEKVIHGNSGTLFLKELLEISIIAYVSRFGFSKLYETTLYLFRCIYSLRVSSGRNVREDSIYKFVYTYQFIDNILEVYTVEELTLFLKKFKYNFNTDYLEYGHSKDKHLGTLKSYFDGFLDTSYYEQNPKEFDKHLLIAINHKIENNHAN